MKTITLTVVVDDSDTSLREEIVRHAIYGIEPSLKRVAESVTLTTEKVKEEGE